MYLHYGKCSSKGRYIYIYIPLLSSFVFMLLTYVNMLACWLMIMVVFLLTIVNSVTAQSNNSVNTNNTLIRSFCDRVDPMSPSVFFSNLNSTFRSLRRQLSVEGVYFAKAENLGDADSVYGTAQCRHYLSAARCLACFDEGVSALARCTTGNGAYGILDDCFIRYQNFGDYYNDPTIIEDVGLTAIGICSHESISEPTFSNHFVEEFLTDIRVATPKTPNFFVASMKKSSSGNATLYAIAQCIQNTSRSICEKCLNTAYNNLFGCLPNTEGKAIDLGCFMRYSVTPFFKDDQTTNITPFLNQAGSSSKLAIIAAAAVGVVFFLVILLMSLWYRIRKRSKQVTEDASELQGATNFSYKDIQKATDNFSQDCRIGRGGFAEVYKAVLDDSNIVAVKKLYMCHDRARVEFGNEVKLMSGVRHRNLVRVLGWSSEGPFLLLVLEYMPQGSLDRFLWGEKKGSLNWKQRFDIIFGIARGLAHLHHEFHVKIIHRDIKSANVLLDDDFQPKIADFGLARFQSDDQSHVSTKFAGTLGYTAPEYATHGHLSEKVDTYSFGVVVLEIISGRRCNDMNTQRSDMYYLLEDAWKLYENNMHVKLVDETLYLNEFEAEHVKKIIEIGLTCTQSPVDLRPPMSEVVLMLSNQRSLVRRTVSKHHEGK